MAQMVGGPNGVLNLLRFNRGNRLGKLQSHQVRNAQI
jgi:hypothetical protein